MKSFLLEKRIEVEGKNDNPWYPWYDKKTGCVVIAENESEAREIAALDCFDEGKSAWLDSKYSSCEELSLEKPQVVLSHIKYA